MDPFTIAALVGGGVQGLGSLFDYFSGAGREKNTQIPLYSPEQQQAFNTLLSQGLGGLTQQPGGGFAPFEQQARERFQQDTIPSIAERFAGTGGSSGLNRALSQAGRGLETDLSAQRMENLHRLLGAGLTPQFQQRFHREPGFFQSMAPVSAQLIPQLLKLGQMQGNQGQGAAGNAGFADFAKMFGAPSQSESLLNQMGTNRPNYDPFSAGFSGSPDASQFGYPSQVDILKGRF